MSVIRLQPYVRTWRILAVALISERAAAGQTSGTARKDGDRTFGLLVEER